MTLGGLHFFCDIEFQMHLKRVYVEGTGRTFEHYMF